MWQRFTWIESASNGLCSIRTETSGRCRAWTQIPGSNDNPFSPLSRPSLSPSPDITNICLDYHSSALRAKLPSELHGCVLLNHAAMKFAWRFRANRPIKCIMSANFNDCSDQVEVIQHSISRNSSFCKEIIRSADYDSAEVPWFCRRKSCHRRFFAL